METISDGDGGDIVRRGVRLLRAGGVISSYGMTMAPKMDWLVQAVMKNIDSCGSTMGSCHEFRDMIAFNQVVLSRTVKRLDNLDAIDSLFQDMRDGKQFGKLAIEIFSPGNRETMTS